MWVSVWYHIMCKVLNEKKSSICWEHILKKSHLRHQKALASQQATCAESPVILGTVTSPIRVIIPASSSPQGHERAQQKVPTTIACTQLTKAPALFHYHKNAVCNRERGGTRRGGGLPGIQGRPQMQPRAFIFSITCRRHLVTCLDTLFFFFFWYEAVKFRNAFKQPVYNYTIGYKWALFAGVWCVKKTWFQGDPLGSNNKRWID